MLHFVPTPIGNLRDITLRALDSIREAEVVFCEDTRSAKKLLSLLVDRNILDSLQNTDKSFISFHSHTKSDFFDKHADSIRNKNCIYISDAGMPCISDPGSELVRFCQENSIEYDFLPGASALTLSYARSGFGDKEFIFYGFLQHKKNERLKELGLIFELPFATILYESPARIMQLVEEIASLDAGRNLYLSKELTKKFQKSFRGTAENLLIELKNSNIDGEWTVVLEQKKSRQIRLGREDILALDLPPKVSAKILSKITGKSTKECYDELIEK